jgi:hypothetical protein
MHTHKPVYRKEKEKKTSRVQLGQIGPLSLLRVVIVRIVAIKTVLQLVATVNSHGRELESPFPKGSRHHIGHLRPRDVVVSARSQATLGLDLAHTDEHCENLSAVSK